MHYILSFEHTYIELQIRTIYDDAFSECDHNYVYKHSSEKSVLSNLTDVLSDISIIGNDISDLMRYISVSDLAQKTDSSVKQHNEIVAKQQFDKISEEIILLNTKFDKIKNNY